MFRLRINEFLKQKTEYLMIVMTHNIRVFKPRILLMEM
jgi:hypothetical protein